LRGIDFYQVPTTLLAMVDSSVGGKTGINLKAGKNLVGAFHQPKAVFIDLECLKSLPKREFSAGMAEVIKYGLLGNKTLFKKLVSFSSPLHSKSEELPEIIETCCVDKAKIVEVDERETDKTTGGRALLNLGHTFAHAIEALHGEAVSIGLVCAIRLSGLRDGSNQLDESSLETLLNSYQLPIRLNSPLVISELINAMQSDKKVSAGKIRFVALKSIGNAFVTSDIAIEDVIKVWKSVGAI
jgi:3-dehydroquinate synthase